MWNLLKTHQTRDCAWKGTESEVTRCDLLKMSFSRVTELPEIKWQRFQRGALPRREMATKGTSQLLTDEMLPLFSAAPLRSEPLWVCTFARPWQQ